MTQYKYKVLEVDTEYLFEKKLNNLGKQGYKIIDRIVFPKDEVIDYEIIYFILEKKLVRKIKRKKHKKVVPMPKPLDWPEYHNY